MSQERFIKVAFAATYLLISVVCFLDVFIWRPL